MLRIGMVEDDAAQRSLLRSYLTRFFQGKAAPEILEYEEGTSFLKALPENLDILFLDIAMGGPNGVEVARKFREKDRKTIIIFVTEMVQYALEGYSVNATDFLIKPVYYNSFCVSLEKALSILRDRMPEMIQITFDKTTTLVDVTSILYIETDGKRTLVHTRSRDLPCTETMKVLEEKLDSHGFVRCHQAFLVNLRFVESVSRQEILVQGKSIPISRYRREEFLRKMTRFVGGFL